MSVLLSQFTLCTPQWFVRLCGLYFVLLYIVNSRMTGQNIVQDWLSSKHIIVRIKWPTFCKRYFNVFSGINVPDSKVHGANVGQSGADRTQVGPCWPNELCYLGSFYFIQISLKFVPVGQIIRVTASNGLVPNRWQRLSEPMLTKMVDVIWCH